MHQSQQSALVLSLQDRDIHDAPLHKNLPIVAPSDRQQLKWHFVSSFALVRGGATGGLPELDEVAHLTPNPALRSDQYNFMSQVDQLSVTHTIDAWRQVNGNPLPTLSWCSLSLTDEVAHEVGPHAPAARAAVRDSDARVGDVLAVIDAAGVRDRTAVVVLADHGMEESDPAVSAGWTPELQATGVAHLEVGGGLIYLT